jgi:hypothetical protein
MRELTDWKPSNGVDKISLFQILCLQNNSPSGGNVMPPEITIEKYQKVRTEIIEEIRNNKPFVFFENDPEVSYKTEALKLVARHMNLSEQDVYVFVRRYRSEIRTFLTAKPSCPPHWSHEEIVSYANIILRVIKENKRM